MLIFNTDVFVSGGGLGWMSFWWFPLAPSTARLMRLRLGHYHRLQMVAIVLGRIVGVTLVEARIAGWPLHHVRLAIHHVTHRLRTVSGRWTCVGGKNCGRVIF